METIKIDFSSRLIGLLQEKNITQKELAKACRLSTQCVSALITGRNNPTGSTVAALSKFFDVSADYLLGLEDDFGVRAATPIGYDMTEKEKSMLKAFRNLLPETQDFVLRSTQSLQDNKKSVTNN